MYMKPIPGFPGYQITRSGRVWSEPKSTSHRKGRWLNPTPQISGHLSVILTKDKRHYRQRVHRLVLETYVGPCLDGMECRHLDGDATNNKLDNLCWGTRSENIQDAIQHGTHFTPLRGRYGEEASHSKLSNWERCVILFDYLTGEFSQAALGREHGVTDVAINHLIRGKTWPFVDIHSIMKRAKHA